MAVDRLTVRYVLRNRSFWPLSWTLLEPEGFSTLPVQGLDEPGGLCLLPDGRLAMADTNNHRILLVDPSSGAAELLPLAAERAEGERELAAAAEVLFSLPLDLGDDDLDPSDGPPVPPSSRVCNVVRTPVVVFRVKILRVDDPFAATYTFFPSALTAIPVGLPFSARPLAQPVVGRAVTQPAVPGS